MENFINEIGITNTFIILLVLIFVLLIYSFGLYQHVSIPAFIPPCISEVRLSPTINTFFLS